MRALAITFAFCRQVLRLSRAGATTATVALAWQIEAAPPLDYSLFIHLLNAAGEKVTQLDTQPRDGFGPLPMTTWPMNATIAGNYALPLPVNLPPGEYTVIVGLYDWQAGPQAAMFSRAILSTLAGCAYPEQRAWPQHKLRQCNVHSRTEGIPPCRS